MANNDYTEKQQKVINGEVPIESMSGQALRYFYKNAFANNDKALLAKIKNQQDILKEESRKRNSQRSSIRTKKLCNHEEIQWKQPKSNEYTEHQWKIVRGEIPYDQVHTNELISIHLKAHNIGDHDLSELTLDIIMERREKSVLKRDQHQKSCSHHKKQKHSVPLAFADDFNCFNFVEQAILLGNIPLDEYTDRQIISIMKTAQANGCEKIFSFAEKLLLYKQHPEALYSVHNHQEAIDLIEELLQLPIRSVEAWFKEE